MTLLSGKEKAQTMPKIHIHATNILGTGAIQLFASLFPALVGTGKVGHVHVSSAIVKDTRASAPKGMDISEHHPMGPKTIWRVLETTFLAHRFKTNGVLLVLGDIPLYGIRKQVLMVHSPFVISNKSGRGQAYFKYRIARALFRLNAKFVQAFIVQSQVMKSDLENTYGSLDGRVHVIPQPPPDWLIDGNVHRSHVSPENGMTLFYPAASYPHKNHELLKELPADTDLRKALHQIILTVRSEDHPGLASDIVHCVGPLDASGMLRHYRDVDALLFLSKKETYGFPLLEGMWIGLPIICPNLPYAHAMCGDMAIYFDPDAPESLSSAIIELRSRLDQGWWPDWTSKLQDFPKTWAECADSFVKLCADAADVTEPA